MSSSVFKPFGVTATASLVPAVASEVVARRTVPTAVVDAAVAATLTVPELMARATPLEAVEMDLFLYVHLLKKIYR